MKTFFRRMVNRLFRRQQYREFKAIYEQIVKDNAATHKAKVIRDNGEEFTGLIVGYSDKHLYLRHSDYAVSFHDFHDVLEVTRIREGEENSRYLLTSFAARKRLSSDDFYFVRFPDCPALKEIKNLSREVRGVNAAFNFGSGLNTGSKMIDFILVIEWNRYWAYLPEEIEVVAPANVIPLQSRRRA